MPSRISSARLTLTFTALLVALAAPVSAGAKQHVVAPGESLWAIAELHNVSVLAIRQANGLTEGQLLQPGLALAIPERGSSGPGTPAARPVSFDGEPSRCRTHTVAAGHSLWKIAKRYNVDVDDLRSLNKLGPSDPLKPGLLLLIPSRSGSCDVSTAGPTPPKLPSAPDEPEKPERGFRIGDVAPPPAWTQTQKSAAERGVNPCNTPDPGFHSYDRWDRAPAMGQMISPQKGGITRGGEFDVMFHFHGHEAARKEWVRVMDGPVLVGIDLGIGSGPYEKAFRQPGRFRALVESVERAVERKTGKANARVRNVGLSAWSAGYGAVSEILRDSYGKQLVDSIILLDGLHCGYKGGSLDEVQLAPFIEFARNSSRGSKFMFVSHSSIVPPGYASTTETANFLVSKLRGRPRTTHPRSSDPMGLDLIARFDRGDFHVRGFKGNDKMDHCAHFGLYRDVLGVHIKRRWRSPRGRKL